jgi:hypothetical protein
VSHNFVILDPDVVVRVLERFFRRLEAMRLMWVGNPMAPGMTQIETFGQEVETWR